MCFTGSAWANEYEVIVRDGPSGREERLRVVDCTKEDDFVVEIGDALGKLKPEGGRGVKVSVRAIGVDGHASEESDALEL